MATANFNLDAEDGWTAVTVAGVDFIRIRSNTNNHAFFVTSAASPPANTTTDAVAATGTITFGGQPIADETVTVGSQVFVFKASAAGALEVTIGGTAAITRDNLTAKINANSAVVTALSSGSTLINLTAVTAGTAGNSIVLTEAATNVTVSGAGTLAGGAAAVPAVIGYKVTCEEFWVDVPTTELYYVRNAENVPQNTRIDVFYIAS
jgi:hypothetical protein